MTTKQQIHMWLKEAKNDGATHMLVVCDTFDHSDYPVSVSPDQAITDVMARFTGKNMQRIMEVYNLAHDIDKQLLEHRAWNV